MHYYQAPDKSIHSLDDVAFEYLLPAGSIQITPAQYTQLSAPTLAQAQDAQRVLLESAYAAAASAPVSVTTAGKVTASFQADAGSVANVQATLLGLSATQATPTGFFWVAADNSQVPFTYADIQGLAAAMLAQGWASFKRLQVAKAAVRAATTVAAVQAVTF